MIPRTVLNLGLISLMGDIASEMLYPVIPLYLTSVLGASMITLGIVEGFADGFANLLKVFVGVWSDRLRKRRIFIFIGYLIAGLAKPALGLSSAWFDVFGLRLLDRVGKGIRTTPRDALLAESVPVSQRATAFGWHRALDTTGAVIGPLLCLAIFPFFQDRMADYFLLALIPGVIAAFMVLLVPREKTHITHEAVYPDFSTKAFKKLLGSHTKIKSYLLMWFIFSVGNSSDAFLLLRAKQLGYSSQEMIGLYCIYNFVYATTAPMLGRLADRYSKHQVLQFSFLLFFVVYFGFGLIESKTFLPILFIIYGLFSASSEGIAKALMLDFVPSHQKATGVGILEMTRGFGVIIAGIWAGLMWETYGPTSPFMWGALTTFASILLIYQIFKNSVLPK